MAMRPVIRQAWRRISIRRCLLGGLVLTGLGTSAICLKSLAGGPLNRHYTRQLGCWLDIWIEEALVTISASASYWAPPPRCLPPNPANGGPPVVYSVHWNNHVQHRAATTPTGGDEIQWQDREDLQFATQLALKGRLFWCGATSQSPAGAVIRFPLWIVPPLAWAWPCWVLVRNWQAQRRRRGRRLCGACGYHLRGNVSGICPECGTRCGARRPSLGAAAATIRAKPSSRVG